MKETKKTADQSNLSVRRRQEIAQAENQKKRTRIYWIIGIVAAVLIAALLIWDNGVIQRNAAAYKVGSYSFSVNDVNYYYNNQYNQVAPYASFYGLDTSKPLDEQEYADGQTWKDFLMEQAKSTMQEVALLNTEAKANGFTLTEDGQKSVEQTLQSMKDGAAQYGITEGTYLNYVYGRFMTLSAYKKLVNQQQLAADYAKHLRENYEITDDDLTAYYEENKASMDTFDYNAWYISLGLTVEYDDDGNAKDFEADALAAAQESAKAKADELAAVVSGGNDEEITAKASELGLSDMSGIGSSSLSYYPFGAWVTDDARTAGESGIVEATATNSAGEEYVNGYYVVRFNSRTLEEYYGVNFYNLLVQAETIQPATEETTEADADTTTDTAADTAAETTYDWEAAEAKANELQEKWLADGGSAEGFLTMAQENSDGSVTEYTNVDRDTQNTEVNAWLFDSEHKAGDYAIIKDETLHGYRLVYFTGYDEQFYWQITAKNAVAEERYNTWLEQAKADVTATETGMFKQVA